MLGVADPHDVLKRLGSLPTPEGGTLADELSFVLPYPVTLADHHARVMARGRTFALSGGMDRPFFDLTLAAHDWGKRRSTEALRRGETTEDLQHERTLELLEAARPYLPVSDAAFERMKALIDGDPIGALFRDKASVPEAAREIRSMAARAGMADRLGEFLDLLLAFHSADVSAYTEQAGGPAFLDPQFLLHPDGKTIVTDSKTRRLRYNDTSDLRLAQLEHALLGEPYRPVSRVVDSKGAMLADGLTFAQALERLESRRGRAIVAPAEDVLQHMGFRGVLYHRAKEPWSGAIDTRRGGGTLGTGFYADLNPTTLKHGDYLKEFRLAPSVLKGKTALFGVVDPGVEVAGVDLSATMLRTGGPQMERFIAFSPRLQKEVNEQGVLTELPPLAPPAAPKPAPKVDVDEVGRLVRSVPGLLPDAKVTTDWGTSRPCLLVEVRLPLSEDEASARRNGGSLLTKLRRAFPDFEIDVRMAWASK